MLKKSGIFLRGKKVGTLRNMWQQQKDKLCKDDSRVMLDDVLKLVGIFMNIIKFIGEVANLSHSNSTSPNSTPCSPSIIINHSLNCHHSELRIVWCPVFVH